MKKYILALVLMTFFFLGCSDEQKDIKNVSSDNSIAIGKFMLSGNSSESQYADLLAGFREYIDDAFSKNSKYKVVNKSRLDEVLSTNGLYESVKIEQTGNKLSIEAVEKYKQANAEYVLLGEIRNFSLDVPRGNLVVENKIRKLSKKHMVLDATVSLSLIHVKTQQIAAKENLLVREIIEDNSTSDTLVSKALNTLAQKVVSRLLVSMAGDIKVISVQNNEVVLDKGSSSGLKKNMELEIFKLININEHSSQSKVAKVKIQRVDKDISFAKFVNLIEMPIAGNIAKLNSSKPSVEVLEKIRVAIADTVINESSINSQKLKDYITKDMEHLLSQNSSLTITKNDPSEMNKVLAQQLLTNLSQGREPGLPMGSLRGVDYLVISNIDYVSFQGEKISIEKLEALGVLYKKKEKAVSSISGYTYIIDVNTGDKISSTPIEIKYEFDEIKDASEAIKSLAKEFSKKAVSSIILDINPIKILKVLNGNAILNVGRDVGLKQGDTLVVYSESSTFINENTGIKETISGMEIAKVKVISFIKDGRAVVQPISGQQLRVGLELDLDKEAQRLQSEEKKLTLNKNGKKFIVIKDIVFSNKTSTYKRKLINSSNISDKIREKVNKSDKYGVLSRDIKELKAVFAEKQLAQSDISDEANLDEMRLSLADLIVVPKITKSTIYRKSTKIPNIESYENKDYINLELSLVVMNTKGQIVFEDSLSDSHSNSWATEKKLKSTVPSKQKIYKILDDLSIKLADKLIEKQL